MSKKSSDTRLEALIDLLMAIRDAREENNGLGMRSSEIGELGIELGIPTILPLIRGLHKSGVLEKTIRGKNVYYREKL